MAAVGIVPRQVREGLKSNPGAIGAKRGEGEGATPGGELGEGAVDGVKEENRSGAVGIAPGQVRGGHKRDPGAIGVDRRVGVEGQGRGGGGDLLNRAGWRCGHSFGTCPLWLTPHQRQPKDPYHHPKPNQRQLLALPITPFTFPSLLFPTHTHGSQMIS